MPKIQLNKINCPICLSKSNFDIVYKANFSTKHLNTQIFSARRIPDRIHYRIVRCQKCGLVRSNPTAPSSLLENLYQKSEFNYQSEVTNLKKTYLTTLKPVLDKLSKNDSILEIGCGNGFILSELKKMGFKNVYGVEPSQDAIDQSDKSIKKSIKKSIFIPNLYPKNTFKLIFFFQTFDHIPHPNTFLKNCCQILAPSGYIFSFNHNEQALTTKILGEKSPIFDIEHTFLYNLKTISQIFSKNKFKIISVKEPYNYLSIKHLIYLFPLPNKLKLSLMKSNNAILSQTIKLPLGNLSLLAQK